jgi:hypothetical protein
MYVIDSEWGVLCLDHDAHSMHSRQLQLSFALVLLHRDQDRLSTQLAGQGQNLRQDGLRSAKRSSRHKLGRVLAILAQVQLTQAGACAAELQCC